MLQRILACCMILGGWLCPVSALSTSAESVILIEAESGRVLYEDNAAQELLIASITKLMTALVAVESGIPLDTVISIPREAVAVEGSSLYLTEGEEITLEALLYGLMLHSGNDAAVAIALTCRETVEAFVLAMNQKAKELGMEQSSFANPHGLNAEEHYSTAKDMARLAQACLENDVLRDIVSTKSIQLSGRSFTNKNKLLWNYEGCIGMKTGYTELAGRTLVSAATRNDMTLICVTLNDRNDWLDHSNLYDYAFETYHMERIEDDFAQKIPLVDGLTPFVSVGIEESFAYPLTEEESIRVESRSTLSQAVAPVIQGELAQGNVTFYLDDIEIATRNYVYLEHGDYVVTERSTIWSKIREFWEGIQSPS